MTTLEKFGVIPLEKPTEADITTGTVRVLATLYSAREAIDYAADHYHRTGVEPTVIKKSESETVWFVVVKKPIARGSERHV